RRLARAARPGEEVGLAHAAGRDRVLERPHDRLLADDLVEVLRPVLAVESGHAAIQARRIVGMRAPAAEAVKVTPELAMQLRRPADLAVTADGSRLAYIVSPTFRERAKPLE